MLHRQVNRTDRTPGLCPHFLCFLWRPSTGVAPGPSSITIGYIHGTPSAFLESTSNSGRAAIVMERAMGVVNRSQMPWSTGLPLACSSQGPTQDLRETAVSSPLFPNNDKAGGCLLLAPPLPGVSYLSKKLSTHHSAWTPPLSFWKLFAPNPLQPCASRPSDRHSSLAAKAKAWQQTVPEATF